MVTIEVVVDNLTSILNAQLAGADRLEICSALCAEGLTPSPALVDFAKENTECSLQAMIRYRSGDFCYNRSEQQLMLEEVKHLKDHGIDGFVIGALDKDGRVDKQFLEPFIDFARKHALEITFHRAIDVAADYFAAFQAICELGFDRVLTSGAAKDALAGLDNIRSAQQQFGQRISVMAGCGIDVDNVLKLIETARINQIHCASLEFFECLHPLNHNVFGCDQMRYGLANINQLHQIIKQVNPSK